MTKEQLIVFIKVNLDRWVDVFEELDRVETAGSYLTDRDLDY